jgi:hypothetical protein
MVFIGRPGLQSIGCTEERVQSITSDPARRPRCRRTLGQGRDASFWVALRGVGVARLLALVLVLRNDRAEAARLATLVLARHPEGPHGERMSAIVRGQAR